MAFPSRSAATSLSWSTSLICFSGVLLLYISLGGHGFWNGVAQGAGLALCLLGAALFGAAIAGSRWRQLGWWLPSRDRDDTQSAEHE